METLTPSETELMEYVEKGGEKEVELLPALERLSKTGATKCRIEFVEQLQRSQLIDGAVSSSRDLMAGETGDFSIKAFENTAIAKLVIKLCVGFKKFKLCLSIEL
ncbi:hypothetical protein [Laspinema olomoucense]|uniref:hypothetical protein n=1 Tax=Laspinema olomoucense TaxID=3231600 RepID=UPI0021BBAEDA|nr:hypothetical protein [Laspinema sp. D3c]MCT7992480.1 hypothetical protein [Laspinema sp. D3c]